MAPLQLDLGILIILKGCHNCQLSTVNCQLSTVNCQFGEAAKQQFICPLRKGDGLFVVFAAGLDGLGTVELL